MSGLLCLGCGDQGVAVGPQDADGGGGEVREGLLAFLLPSTALLPGVTPALLVTVPALERGTRGRVKSSLSDTPQTEALGVFAVFSVRAQPGFTE